MASFIYNSARESFLKGDLGWDNSDPAGGVTGTIKVAFKDVANYAPADTSTDDFWTDIDTTANILTDGTSPSLGSTVSQDILDNGSGTPSIFATTDGVAGISNYNVTEVDNIGSGWTVDGIIIYKSYTVAGSNTSAAWPLICHIDTGSGFTAGTTNGQPIDIVWAGSGIHGDNIFKL
jgi:hypothetical protein